MELSNLNNWRGKRRIKQLRKELAMWGFSPKLNDQEFADRIANAAMIMKRMRIPTKEIADALSKVFENKSGNV